MKTRGDDMNGHEKSGRKEGLKGEGLEIRGKGFDAKEHTPHTSPRGF